ncbi:hypothetical protein H4219_004780 [Mycoemilia scoparia]|uniref:Uncharacterized protein n=1 Tax=Mycoemilia scoparia TaxID=417184 RepID=A0A9W8DRA4_9FUNG|nr:hypothetical protein H4219_004780 [Mycoemilia scoparia]
MASQKCVQYKQHLNHTASLRQLMGLITKCIGRFQQLGEELVLQSPAAKEAREILLEVIMGLGAEASVIKEETFTDICK